MAGDFVSNDQASGMGGADKPAGAQAENTYQDNKIKQLVVLVRYKPKPAGGFDTGAAASMLDGVTSAVEGAVSAAESAIASIPGLNLFIKEEKKDSTAEKEYTFFKDYSGWDKVFKQTGNDLKELNPENLTDTFEFSSTDAEGRKEDAKELLDKVKSKISSWSKYTAAIHFVGVGQGGNVANECTALMAQDSTFTSEKWFVKSIIYVGTPLYKSEHLVNEDAYKGKGSSFSFGNDYDLTQNAIDCFDNNEKLLKLIADSNKNVMSLMVGKVKLRIIEILSILLSGLHLSADNMGELDKFKQIKDGVVNLVEDVIDLIKKVINEGTSFVDLGDLPEFSKIMDGYDRIPTEAVNRLQQFIDRFTKSAADQAKSADISLSPKDLAGALNCLCPVFDAVAGSLSIFKPGTPTGEQLSAQIIEQAGITKVFALAGSATEHIAVDAAYESKATSNPDKPEQGRAFIKTVQGQIDRAAAKTSDVSAMSSAEKAQVASAVSSIVQPMLASKRKLYAKLLEMIPFDINKFMEGLTADKLMAIPGGMLEKLNIGFPEELKQSIANADAEVKRIRGYFDRNNFELPEGADTLYFIYNSHNLTLKKMYGPVSNCLDQQTGYLDFMRSKGFENEVTLDENKYKQGSGGNTPNVMPAKEVPVAS